ncbi:uncharacterized protein LOC119709392 isoform X1 [Motacilla alba alba]|uniref:uncharacterized protein LOC119709392 isoform X1 n=1 Tax=Motacilla alba alba TaxID=1094192 RepID=UPI0018D52678|nr:uncharacterized protein LOC119709392 isoform X1 [Motacilla alba alba]
MSPVPPTRPRGVPSRPPNMASRGRRRAPSWPAPGSGGPAGEVPPSGERLKRGPRSTPSGEGDADPCRYFPQPCPRPGRSLPSHAEAHPAWIAATLSPAAVSALGTLRPDCISPGCIYGKSERTALSLEKSLSDNPFPWSYCSINHTEHIRAAPGAPKPNTIPPQEGETPCSESRKKSCWAQAHCVKRVMFQSICPVIVSGRMCSPAQPP